MITCDTNIKYYGLPPVLNNIVSCTKCSDHSKIPFIGLDVDNNPG